MASSAARATMRGGEAGTGAAFVLRVGAALAGGVESGGASFVDEGVAGGDADDDADDAGLAAGAMRAAVADAAEDASAGVDDPPACDADIARGGMGDEGRGGRGDSPRSSAITSSSGARRCAFTRRRRPSSRWRRGSGLQRKSSSVARRI